MSTTTKVAAALISAGLVCIGCGARKASSPSAAPESRGLAEVQGPQARVELGYQLFFREADAVLSVDLVKLRKNPVVAQQIERALSMFKGATECLFPRAQRIVWAMKQASTKSVMVVRGHTPDQAATCVNKLKLAAKRPSPTTMEVTAPDGQRVFIHWLDDITALGGNLPRARIEQLAAGKGKLNENLPMVTILEDVDKEAALFGGGLVPASAASTPMGTIKGVHFSLRVKGGIALRAVVLMDTPQAAESAAKAASQMMPMLASSSFAELASNTVVTSAGSDVIFKVKLTNDQLRSLVHALENDENLQKALKQGLKLSW